MSQQDLEAKRARIEQTLAEKDEQGFAQMKKIRDEGISIAGFDGMRFEKKHWSPDLQEAIDTYDEGLKAHHFESENSSRDLDGYVKNLGMIFQKKIKQLTREGGHWVDLGAGPFKAVLQLLKKSPETRSGKELTITAFNHVDLMPPGQLKSLSGSKTISVEQIVGDFVTLDVGSLAPADLISDLYGAATYSAHLDQLILKAAKMLAPGGVMILKSNWANTHLVGKDGLPISVTRWFNQIRGLALDEGSIDGGSVVLYRTDEKLNVPALKLVRFGRGMPAPIPARVYVFDLR